MWTLPLDNNYRTLAFLGLCMHFYALVFVTGPVPRETDSVGMNQQEVPWKYSQEHHSQRISGVWGDQAVTSGLHAISHRPQHMLG